MGLAGAKNKRKVGIDPNNTKWSRNTESFGQKMLRAKGWEPGQYLGAKDAPHASSYTEANVSHIRVTLKDDNMGLGAKRNNGDECTGLDAFQTLLGRLNGKTEDILESERKAREDTKLGLYVERKMGTIRFVKGGWLVGDTIKDAPVEKEKQPTRNLIEEFVTKNLEDKEISEAAEKKSKKRKADEEDDKDDEKARKKEKKDKKEKKRRSDTEAGTESDDSRSKRKEKKSKKRKSDNDDDDSTSSSKRRKDKSAETGESGSTDTSTPEVKLSKKERKEKKAQDKKEKKAQDKKEKKERKERRRKARASSGSEAEAGDSTSREKKRRKASDDSAGEEPASGTSTPGGSGYSTPAAVTTSSRFLSRQRFIAQKRMAFTDTVALNQIFMIKS
ncbi:hypothetical protein B0T22DRAFT_533392 [Podospora appendiculata]|uniref:PinX1-related protein 1 n=1 Tax=Podospora appendiculata TaxID=314037 RepID=A0AAE0XJ00_9PEZI|nr:hypothetical protein B0T22DRAFT_533392 [Podospora appendiculata]